MSALRSGHGTLLLERAPGVLAAASVVGKKEGAGALAGYFDRVETDASFGQKSWERAESAMLRECLRLACEKAGIAAQSLDAVLAGDLINQCAGSSYALRDCGAPFIGLYGACSTMAEALCLAAVIIDGGGAGKVAALTGSHFCTAERQFRFPLEYGALRTPSSQWTVTGAGALILSDAAPPPYVTCVTFGVPYDAGIKDTSDMGAAMAPAACSTLLAHFAATGREPDFYDAVITGDLGRRGSDILAELLEMNGLRLGGRHIDCGSLIYGGDRSVKSGGSGCGCSASVLAGYVLSRLRSGEWKRVLFAATGALMSGVTSQQGESIPGVCHAAALEMERD